MKQHIPTRMAMVAIAAIVSSSAALAAETNIWSTSFDDLLHPYDENTGPWVNVDYPPTTLLLGPTLTAVPSGSALTSFGSTYLQGSGLDLGTFSLAGVGLGTVPEPVNMHLQFDLAYQDGWDPADTNPATDGVAFSLDGTTYLWNAANGFGATAGGPGMIVSTGSNVLGPTGSDTGLNDTVVHYDFAFTHIRPDIMVSFQLQGMPFIPITGVGPGWGLDNISLSAITGDDGGPGDGDGGTITPGGVPEAPIWALMVAGFGVIGAAARRSQAVFD